MILSSTSYISLVTLSLPGITLKMKNLNCKKKIVRSICRSHDSSAFGDVQNPLVLAVLIVKLLCPISKAETNVFFFYIRNIAVVL